MIPTDLPPVGDPVATGPSGRLPTYRGYRACWLDSGTAALALALLAAKQQRPALQSPEVIVPAYGCPDLVAACVFAGVTPRLVDIGADDAGYDFSALERALSEHTLAVIAVNFLGVAERLEAIQSLLPPETWLVEDDAQWYPESVTDLRGEAVVTSFGRGKPASMLGGGLLLLRENLAIDSTTLGNFLGPAAAPLPLWKIRAYNALLRPYWYFWLNRLPGLGLGQTVYHRLDAIETMPPRFQGLVAANVKNWLARSRDMENRYDAILARSPFAKPLVSPASRRRRRLLRYPVVCCDRATRDRLYAALRQRGLGASLMYRQPLEQIPGVARDVLTPERYPGAEALAGHLLTLPLHRSVDEHHAAEIEQLLKKQI